MAKRAFYWVSIISLLTIFLIGHFWKPFLWLLIFAIPYTLIGLYDIFISTHNVLRSYPVIGHIRSMMEQIRPEMQQYFVATNQSERPFNRETRSLVYQRAKHVTDTLPFGTQKDIGAMGYEFANHSIAPKEVESGFDRVIVGGSECAQPYSASILNISAMSYGALGHSAIEALNWGAKMGDFAHNTGEGGLTPHHLQNGGNIIMQLGTGYFGCRTPDGDFDPDKFVEKANLEVVKMIEIKISQGAKPSHGGLLPAAKISAEIAEIRGVPMGQDCLSPPAHRQFSTPIGLLEYVARLRELSGGKPIGFKLCIGIKSEFLSICKAMVESGIYPDFITIDGAEGGTGAAPIEFSNRLGTPINKALIFVHQALVGCDLRDKLRIIASGKVATGFDVIHKLAIGADMCNAARTMMFSIGCIQALKCNTNECPTGVATQDKSRNDAVVPSEKRFHVYQYHKATIDSFEELLGAMGLSHANQLQPYHILRRISESNIQNYGDIYPNIEPGILLSKTIPKGWEDDWKHASSTQF